MPALDRSRPQDEELMDELKSEYTLVIGHNMQQAAAVSDFTASCISAN